MGRIVGFLGLMLLPGCSSDQVDGVQLTVSNQGAEDVHVRGYVKDQYFDTTSKRLFDVAAGESQTVGFNNVTMLEVQVIRISDQSIIFDATWGTDELRDLHRKVSVMVSP